MPSINLKSNGVKEPSQNNQDTILENKAKSRLQNAQIAVPMGLLPMILQRLAFERNQSAIKRLKFQLWSSLVFFAGALGSLVIAVRHSLVADSTSLKFLSLAFTDFGSVIHNWQDYSFSVLENLPLGTMVFLLGALLGSVLLGEFVINRWRNFKNLRHITL